jgi:type II secretion system protein N
MATDTPARNARLRRIAGYAAFTVFSLVLCLYLTFPYDVVERQVRTSAAQAGYLVEFGSLGPGLFGVTARGVKLMRQPAAGQEADPTAALLIDRVSARPSLLPLGLALSADAFGGDVSGHVGVVGTRSVRLSLEGLDPKKGNFQGFTGVDLDGRINGELALDIPVTPLPGGKVESPDLGSANGLLTLDLANLQVNGGTLKGDLPLDLPKAALGTITARIKFDKGTGTLETLEGTGEDLQLGGEGTVTLARILEASQLNMTVRLKPSPDFTRSAGIVGSGISFLPPDKKDPTFRAARLAGTLTRPAFLPAR